MADKDASEALVVLSTFQEELTELEAKYQTYLLALKDSDVQGTNSALQHVILLESATQDVSVQLLMEHRSSAHSSPGYCNIGLLQQNRTPQR